MPHRSLSLFASLDKCAADSVRALSPCHTKLCSRKGKTYDFLFPAVESLAASGHVAEFFISLHSASARVRPVQCDASKLQGKATIVFVR